MTHQLTMSRLTCSCPSVGPYQDGSATLQTKQTCPTPNVQLLAQVMHICQPAVRHGTALNNSQGFQGTMSNAIQWFALDRSSLACFKFCYCITITTMVKRFQPRRLQAVGRYTMRVLETLTASAGCVPAGSRYPSFWEPKCCSQNIAS